MDSTAHDLPPGTDVDRYRIEGPIGEGGFGSVYRAQHTLLGHAVAIKLLHPEHARNPEILERFFREARTAASVGSDHIVKVTDCGTSSEGQPFLVMELLHGEGLDSVMVCLRPLPAARALDIGVQILDGLAAAHTAGIVHRDLKPGNVFIARDPGHGGDLVKLLDFGISKFRGDGQGPSLTRTGAVLGTPLYMAPEQFRGARDVDHRGDLYSAAAVIFEMISGQVPHTGDSYIELASRVMTQPAERLSAVMPELHPSIADAIDKGLSSEPDTRWSNAGDFAAALQRAADAAGLELSPPLGGANEPGGQPPCDSVAWAEAPGVAAEAVGLPAGGSPGATAGMATPVPTEEDVQGDTAPGGALPLPAAGAAVPIAPAPATGSPPVGALAVATDQPPAVAAMPTPGAPAPAAPPQAARRRRSPLIWVGLGLLVLALLGGATVAVLLALRGARTEPARVATPAPLPTPTPALPLQQPPVQQPSVPTEPTVQGLEPLGQLVQTLVGVAEEAASLSGMPPAAQQQTPVLQVHEPRIAGDIDGAAIRQVLGAAQPAMERCRLPGQTVQVRAQIRFVDPGRISMAAPAPGNPGPPSAAQCCADCFRESAPGGFDPGSTGVVFFDVTLPAR